MKTAIFSIGVFLISLFLGSCQPSETSCSVVDTGKTLDYKIGDKLLFSYNYTTVYPAPGVDSVYKRSGFIHPLKTLGGEVMTNCSPADHYHHSVCGMPGRKLRSKETRSISGISTKTRNSSLPQLRTRIRQRFCCDTGPCGLPRFSRRKSSNERTPEDQHRDNILTRLLHRLSYHYPPRQPQPDHHGSLPLWRHMHPYARRLERSDSRNAHLGRPFPRRS